MVAFCGGIVIELSEAFVAELGLDGVDSWWLEYDSSEAIVTWSEVRVY